MTPATVNGAVVAVSHRDDWGTRTCSMRKEGCLVDVAGCKRHVPAHLRGRRAQGLELREDPLPGATPRSEHHASLSRPPVRLRA